MFNHNGAESNGFTLTKGSSGSFATSPTRTIAELGASLQSQASEPSTTPEPRDVVVHNSSASSPRGNHARHWQQRHQEQLQMQHHHHQQQQQHHLQQRQQHELLYPQQKEISEIHLERPHMNFLASLAVARLALAQWASRVVTLSNLHPKITCYHLADTFEAFGSVAYAHVETDANGRSLCTGVVLFSEESDAATLASYGTLQLFDQPVELLHGVPGAMFTTTRPGLPVSLPVLQMSTAPAGHPHVLSDFPVPPVGIPSELSVSAGVAEIDLVAHSVGGDKVELLVEAACESLVGSHESEDNAALLEEEMAGGETIVEVLPAEAAEMLEAAKVDEVAETTEAADATEATEGAHSTKPVEPAQSADGNEVERKIALKEDEQLQAKAVSKQERKGLHGQKQKRQQKGKKKKNLKGVDLPAATLSQEAEVRKEGETKMQAVKKASRSKDTRPEQETKEKRSKRKQSRTPPRKAQTAGAATTVEATTPSSKQAQDKAVAAKSSKSSPSADQKGSNRRRQNTPKTKARKVEEPAGTGESSRGTPAKAVQSSPASSQVHSAQKARAPRNRKMAGAKSKSPPPLPLEGSGRSRDREGEKVVKAKVKTKAEPKRQQRNSKSEEKPERKKGPAKEFSAEIKAEAQKTSPTKHSRQKGGASRKSSPSNPADKKSMSKDSREQKKRSASSPSSSSPSPAPSSSNRTKVLFCAEETSLRTSKRSAVRARSEADASASVASSMPSSSQPRGQRKRAETAPEVQRNASKIQFKGKTKGSGKVKTTIMLESNAAATGRRAGNKQQQQQQQQKGKQAKGFLVF